MKSLYQVVIITLQACRVKTTIVPHVIDTGTNPLLLRCRLYRIVELCQRPDSAAYSHRLIVASIYQYLNNNRDQNNIRHVSIISTISKYPLSQSTKERKTFPVDNFCVHTGLPYQLHGRLDSDNIGKCQKCEIMK